MKTVIYCRVSTQEQAIHGYSVLDQKMKLLEFAEYKFGLSESDVNVLTEEGESASSMSRTKMKVLVDLIDSRKVNRIIVYSLDRLSRDMLDYLTFLKKLEAFNVDLVSMSDDYDFDTAIGSYMSSHTMLMAEWERKTISERTIRGMDRSAIEGNYSKGGRTPFGYERIDHKLSIIDEEKKVVELIFNNIANKNFSVNKMAKLLKKEFPFYGTWPEPRVKNILGNHIYYGRFKNGRLDIDNHSPKIVTKELFVKANRQANKRRKMRRYKYAYSELIFCGDCDTKMIKTSGTGRNKVYLYYRCNYCKKNLSEIALNKLMNNNVEIKLKNNKKHTKLSSDLNQLNNKIAKLDMKLLECSIGFDEYVNMIDDIHHRKVMIIKDLQNDDIEDELLSKIEQIYYYFINKKIIIKCFDIPKII